MILELTWIRNVEGFIIEPSFWLLGLRVNNLIGGILIPISGLQDQLYWIASQRAYQTHLLGLGVRNLFRVHPIFRFLVIRVVDLFGRVYGRIKVLEQTTG